MVVGEASIHNIMGGMESTGGVRLHNHKRKLKQRYVCAGFEDRLESES